MKDYRADLVNYRLQRAHTALEEAALLRQAGFITLYVSRLYYACFYVISALLFQNGFKASTHTGIQQLFTKHFVKTGIVSKDHGAFYSTIFQRRQESDYKDFYQVDPELASAWLQQATEFVSTIEQLIANNRNETS